ncbi:aminoacyl-tRNA hydrolase, partial [Morganella morganii]|nr:aminoacyl-tRNA hydrolase [Morganella morganii]
LFPSTTLIRSLKSESKLYGFRASLNIRGNDVRLMIPTTFIKLCGKAVGALDGFYQIAPDEILVAHDELDLPPGMAKMKLG